MNVVETAKRWIIYKNITESMYIPGENFSFGGVPYLLGKGMDMKSIKIILSKYSSVVDKEMNF